MGGIFRKLLEKAHGWLLRTEEKEPAVPPGKDWNNPGLDALDHSMNGSLWYRRNGLQ